MIKKFSIGLACLGCLVLSLSAVYFVQYLMDWNEEFQSVSEEQAGASDDVVGGSAIHIEANSKASKVLKTMNQKKTADMDTEYYVTTVNLDEHTSIRKKMTLPNEWRGYTREQIVESIKEYVEDLPLEEVNRGFSSFELISFSPERVETKKVYQPSMIRFLYYVTVKNHMVVVYHKDKKTIFEYTGIDSRQLDTAEQLKLNDGIYIETQEELYGLLESYSS